MRALGRATRRRWRRGAGAVAVRRGGNAARALRWQRGGAHLVEVIAVHVVRAHDEALRGLVAREPAAHLVRVRVRVTVRGLGLG